jgi:hypothetical protein
MDDNELKAARDHFKCVDSRTKINSGDFVISRYSALPFFKEQVYDIECCIGAKLINNISEHNYIADMQNWYYDLYELTPKTWFRLEEVPNNEGPFVLKGATNSRKNQWNTHMFAKDKKEACEVFWKLCNDALIIGSDQSIYIRKYEPLVKLLDGIGGIPVSKEFRFFICNSTVISKGYYWSNYIDDIDMVPDVNEVPEQLINNVIRLVGGKSNFFVVDVAQKANGDWIVVELNDGCQSGLSENNPEDLYKNLKSTLTG